MTPANPRQVSSAGPGHGFASPARDSQAVFRTVMQAMARPGAIEPLACHVQAPAPLLATSAALVLALADFETPIWLDEALARSDSVRDFVRFHCGSRLVSEPRDAAFAVVSMPLAMPALQAFNQGLPQFPDRSTTIIVEVEQLSNQGWTLHGPGIKGEIGFSAAPLPADFGRQLLLNREGFPLGVDVVLVTPMSIAALPRSVHVKEG